MWKKKTPFSLRTLGGEMGKNVYNRAPLTNDKRILHLKSEEELYAEDLYRQYLIMCESELGDKETDTDQLNKIGYRAIPHFKGTFARDEIPKKSNHEKVLL